MQPAGVEGGIQEANTILPNSGGKGGKFDWTTGQTPTIYMKYVWLFHVDTELTGV